MRHSSSRLPSRFPIGTKFVIEGRPAKAGEVHVIRRYVEFPDGTLLRLPARPDKVKAGRIERRPRSTRVSHVTASLTSA
jgi:hypothetical protein